MALLADRFKLVVHREPRPSQVYVLEVAKSGAKLTESQNSTQTPGCQRGFGSGPELSIVAECRNVSMDQLAQQVHCGRLLRDGRSPSPCRCETATDAN